jgi:hypothetical protein
MGTPPTPPEAQLIETPPTSSEAQFIETTSMPGKAQPPSEPKGFHWEALIAMSNTLLALAALLALTFSWGQISEFREAEKVHQLVEQKRFFNSAEFRYVRKMLGHKRLDNTGKLLPLEGGAAPQEMYDLLNYFDEVGLLQKKGYLAAEDVFDQLGDWVFNYEKDGKSVIEYERLNDPYSYENLERLVGILQQIQLSKTGKRRDPSTQELEGMYQYSKSLSTGVPSQ